MTKMICIKASAWIRESPKKSLVIEKKDSQMIYGEEFVVEHEEGPFFFGHAVTDGYQGYVTKDSLGEITDAPTHKVCLPMTYSYRAPTFKLLPVKALPLFSKIKATNEIEDGFQRLEADKPEWIFADHIMPVTQNQTDYVKTALLYLNAPYVYGGQVIGGIDCSGLVRVSLLHAGIECPRDCDQQIEALKEREGALELRSYQRGDIIYFEGHVAIMLNAKYCVNATARHMKTIVEKLDDLIEAYGRPKGVKNFLEDEGVDVSST